jgi:hypothetical protein
MILTAARQLEAFNFAFRDTPLAAFADGDDGARDNGSPCRLVINAVFLTEGN